MSAPERVAAYLNRRAKIRADGSDHIHGYDAGCESEAVLSADDLAELLARIATLEAEKAKAEALLAEAVEALRPFAEAVKGNYFYQSDDLLISSGHGKDDLRWVIPLGDWRLARALIARIKEAKDG